MAQDFVSSFLSGLGFPPKKDIVLPNPDEPMPKDINSILGKATSIGPTTPRPATPEDTLGKATSIGPPGIQRSLPIDYSQEFLRRNQTVPDIISELGLHPFENMDRGAGSLAGLPFSAYRSKLPLGYVTHGTPNARNFEKLDPAKRDIGDILGWARVHAAEDPEYSNDYAMGYLKHMNNVESPAVLPLTSDANNVLDLIDPNMDDLSQAVAGLDPVNRSNSINKFREARRVIRRFKEEVMDKYSDTKSSTNSPSIFDMAEQSHEQFLRNKLGLKSIHFPEGVKLEEGPMRVLAEYIRYNEDSFHRTPFDAIRYHDINRKSWAFSKKAPVRSIFGHKFTDDGIPLKVIKSDKSGGGVSVLAPGYNPSNKLLLDSEKLHYWNSINESKYTNALADENVPLDLVAGKSHDIAPWSNLDLNNKKWATGLVKFDPNKKIIHIGSSSSPKSFSVHDYNGIMNNLNESLKGGFIAKHEYAALKHIVDNIITKYYTTPQNPIEHGFKIGDKIKLNMGSKIIENTIKNQNDLDNVTNYINFGATVELIKSNTK